MKYLYLVIFLFIGIVQLKGQDTHPDVEDVYVCFKTHLDVGYTDLSSAVIQRYVTDFIPKALDVAERLKAEGSDERYVWTTGAWLIWKYLHTASPQEVERLETAIRQEDIVYNAVPYTVETESMNKDLFETCLSLSKRLDAKYGKHTIAAKMTDVPGHTRSIIPLLNNAGINFLHIGVNPASAIPGVPQFCRWRDTDGSEIVLVHQKYYGQDDILPGGKTAISINFTNDNHGPHTYEQVKKIYAGLHKRYPNARLIPASFNEIAQELNAIKDQLPVVTSEIGDTWIYGYGSNPIRMAKFRALQNLYSKWLEDGKIDRDSDEALKFALELGLIGEHTWGLCVQVHLHNWDKYDMDPFLMARHTPTFKHMEASWEELDNYIYSSLRHLPKALHLEALAELDKVDRPYIPTLSKRQKKCVQDTWSQAILQNGALKIGGLTYQMFDSKDYDKFLASYTRHNASWVTCDLGKPGLDKSQAVSASVAAQVVRQEVRREKDGIRTTNELAFPDYPGIDSRVYPQKIYMEIFDNKKDGKATATLTILGKPAVRLPEAYWLSFDIDDIVSIVAEKTGKPVDLLDVVEKGNRQQHGIDRYVDLVTSSGTVRIRSEAAFLVNIGEAKGLNYSLAYPDKQGGIHFNLSNNLWNTNFSMWNEGSLTYRFSIEWID